MEDGGAGKKIKWNGACSWFTLREQPTGSVQVICLI